MTLQPTTKEAYDLLHRGALTLNRVSANGMRIDVPYLKKQVRILQRKKDRAEARLLETEVGRAWKQHYGDSMALSKDQQLSHLLFKVMNLEAKATTDKGNPSVKRGALEDLDVPGLDVLIEWRKLDKTLGTYVLGILKEQVDGVLRPFFSLNTTVTYRSSSSAFNFQNIPVRDKEQGRTVREAINPWWGQRLLEVDYGGLEVRIAACYHQDPVMLKYLIGQGDMHKDSACDLFGLTPDQVTKEVRFYTKNGWVFPQFYGSYYGQCAPNLWSFIDQHQLATADGVPLKTHMRESLGVKNLSQFERHCQAAEDEMWNKRFIVYRDWKRDWVKQYEKRGHIELKTGFRCQGTMARNDVINYPVQGAAFHCLLWSLIRLNETSQNRKWETKLIGQIHDSAVSSASPDECDTVVDTIFRVSTQELVEAWPWIVVPLEVEVEAGPVDRSWYHKSKVQEIRCNNGHKYARRTGDVSWECLTCGEVVIPS